MKTSDRTLRPGGWCCRCHEIGDVFEGADLPMWCTRCAGEWCAAQTPTVDELIKAHALAVLDRCGGNKSHTAERLGVSLKTLYNWLNKWELSAAAS